MVNVWWVLEGEMEERIAEKCMVCEVVGHVSFPFVPKDTLVRRFYSTWSSYHCPTRIEI